MDLLAALRSVNLDESLAKVLERFGCNIGTIHVIGPDGKLHLRAHTSSLPADLLEASRIIPLGKGLAGIAAQSKRATSTNDLFTDSSPRLPDVHDSDPAGAICVPMLDAAHDVVGTLGIASSSPRTFTAEEQSLLGEAARVIAARL